MKHVLASVLVTNSCCVVESFKLSEVSAMVSQLSVHVLAEEFNYFLRLAGLQLVSRV